MTEPAPIYNHTPTFPTKADKLICRVNQVIRQRKGHIEPLIFTLVIQSDGRWQLIPPPPQVEHLGSS